MLALTPPLCESPSRRPSEPMMGRKQIERRIVIQAPAEAVWQVLADSRLLPQWVPAVDVVTECSSDGEAVGEVRHCNATLAGKSLRASSHLSSSSAEVVLHLAAVCRSARQAAPSRRASSSAVRQPADCSSRVRRSRKTRMTARVVPTTRNRDRREHRSAGVTGNREGRPWEAALQGERCVDDCSGAA